MIKQEIIQVGDMQLVKTYSDTYIIECDGERYSEAVDVMDSGRVYVETDILLDSDSEDGDAIVSAEAALEELMAIANAVINREEVSDGNAE